MVQTGIPTHPQVARMREYAAHFQIEEFFALGGQLLSSLEGSDLGEVYSLLAQAKLFLCDATLEEDLQNADRLHPDASPTSPFFADCATTSPNTFFLIPLGDKAFTRFAGALRAAQPLFQKHCGDIGYRMNRQIESEIRYYWGQLDEAIALAEPLYYAAIEQEDLTMAIHAGYTLIRCYLAKGETIFPIISRIIEWARAYPGTHYAAMYEVIRQWANATTGWSGDTPRYHTTPMGTIMPVLDDRVDAIVQGIGEPASSEKPFDEFLRGQGTSHLNMRGFYVEIFNAMTRYKFSTRAMAEEAFYASYQISLETGLIMPFVEYGLQIVPLLEYILDEDLLYKYDEGWVRRIIDYATRYEENLQWFRQ